MSIDPEKASALLSEHFDGLSSEEFQKNARAWAPELVAKSDDTGLEALKALPAAGGGGATGSSEIDVLKSRPEFVPLRAYLASGLTGLGEVERQLIFHLSDTIAEICRSHGIELYEPRKSTDPVHHPDVSDTEVFDKDRQQVLSRDLLILLAHFPSTGAGQELDFALNGLVPIIVVAHANTRVSRMITGVPNLYLLLTYNEPEELRAELSRALGRLRPLLVERKLAIGAEELSLLGPKVKELRRRQGLSRQSLVAKLSVPGISVHWLGSLEEQPDGVSNPTLTQLRALAAALNTTTADLVEPDLAERVVDYLDDWASPRWAARAPGMSVADRNKIIRRILLRVIDNLEDD